MKLRVMFLFIISLCLVSCASQHATAPENLAGAYFVVFETLYENDPGLNSEINYIAADLTNIKLTDTAPLVALLTDFCKGNGYVFLQDTYEGLVEKGYIHDFYFEEGVLITFNDKELRHDKLVTSAEKWRSGLGAIGADYEVQLKNSSWEITKTENMWIS